MKKFYLIFFSFIFVFTFGQNTFEPNSAGRTKSTVTMPVRIPLSEISNMVNSSVKDLIFADDSYTDNNNDQFKVKVWRTSPVRLIGGTDQNLLIEVPLKIWAEKGIGKFGLYSYQQTTFETVMYFSSKISFLNNWTALTKTTSRGFKWRSKPVLDFGGIKVPIAGLVEESLLKQQQEFTKTMDEMMLEQLNFQQYAVLAWNTFAQPFEISEKYSTWLKLSPERVSITPLVFYRDAIDFTIGVDVYSETFTGSKPLSSPLINNIANFNSVQNLPSDFFLQTTSHIPFSEAERIADELFLNKTFDFIEGKTVTITDIKVYGEQQRIQIEAETQGAVKGKVLISGVPVYDALKRRIVLSDTDFKLKTKNILHKTATSLFRGKIVRMIEEEYGIPTDELENTARKSVNQAFNTEYYKGLKISGAVYSLKPSSVYLQPTGIIAMVDIYAQLRLMIQGLQ